MSPPDVVVNGLPKVKTSVPFDTLKEINEELLDLARRIFSESQS